MPVIVCPNCKVEVNIQEVEKIGNVEIIFSIGKILDRETEKDLENIHSSLAG
jgi:hypothetical protein